MCFLQGPPASRRKSRTVALVKLSAASRYHLGGGDQREGEIEGGMLGRAKGSLFSSSSRGEEAFLAVGVAAFQVTGCCSACSGNSPAP